MLLLDVYGTLISEMPVWSQCDERILLEEYTHSDTALDGLLAALDDPDHDIQFAVMQSLGNLTNQHYWRPNTLVTDAQWSACIQHWREFGERRRPLAVPSTTLFSTVNL